MRILKAAELEREKVTAFIYAPPGMGKTTLLTWIAVRLFYAEIRTLRLSSFRNRL